MVVAAVGLLLLGGGRTLTWITAGALEVGALLVVYMTTDVSPGARWGARGVAALAVIVLGTSMLGPDHATRISVGLVGATLTAILALTLLRAIAVQPVVDSRTILGAITVYVVIGLLFAQLYGATAAWQGTFFANAPETTIADYTYYSYVTLTTVGYGDFVPATHAGRTMAIAEAMIGQLYLVTVLAVIVSNLGRQHSRGDNHRPTEDAEDE